MRRQWSYALLAVWITCGANTLLFAQAKSVPKPLKPAVEAPKAGAAPKADAPKAAPAAKPAAEAPKPAAGAAPKAAPAAEKTPAPAARGTMAGMALGRAITDNSLFFLTTNGWKSPDAASANKTDKLWAEQSIQDFFDQLKDEIHQVIEQQAEGNAQATLAASTMPILISTAIEHPIAVSLISVVPSNPPRIQLSVVIDTESDMKDVKDAFDKLIEAAPEEGPNALEEETIAGVPFYSPTVPEQQADLVPQFGMYKSYLILTIGEGITADTIKRLDGNGPGPAALEATLREFKIDQPSMVWQADGAAIWKTIDPLITDEKVRTILDATGLRTIKRIAAATGHDAVSTVDKVVMETTEAPRGVLALLPNKPLTPIELKGIPASVSQAWTLRFDLQRVVDTVLGITDKVDPAIRQQYDGFCQQGEQILGFSIQNDLLKGFGDVWSSYVSSTESGGPFVPGIVFTISVRDEQKLKKVNTALIELAKSGLAQMGPQAPVALQDFTSRNLKGHRLQINNLPLAISPSWIITKDQFVLGLTPQLVTAHLGNKATTSLADNDEIKAAFKRDPSLLMISYRDPKPELRGLYTLINTFSPMALGQLRQQGVEFNLPPLPPLTDIEPLLSPSVATFSQTATGWRSESHGVIPSFSAATPAVAAVAAALLLPAVGQAREAARRTQSKNNLKMIGLAMHNYHDTFNKFPEREVILDKDKPGLSWRVKLLPYLDQAPLYNQFHLDEPWDSEHNKALIEQLPPCYASTNDPELNAQGKTRYVVPIYPGSMFDGEDGPTIRNITDGTSNTILAVEARPDAAVVWTAPDDLEIDAEEMLKGLAGARTGGFHALFADGSVRFISDNIDITVLKALLTMAGGEVIGDF